MSNQPVFDVFGIGNALLDLEYNVNSTFFERTNIQKGVRSLVKYKKFNKYLEALKQNNYILSLKSSGGSAANTMSILQMLSGKAYFCCKVASDPDGNDFIKYLQDIGVSLSNNSISLNKKHHTGSCLAMVSEDADRTMATTLGVSSNFKKKDIDKNALKNSKMVYIEGYLLGVEKSFQISSYLRKKANKYNIPVVLTLSDPMLVKTNLALMHSFVAKGVDIVFCNYEEAKMFTQTETLESVAKVMQTIVDKFVITLGNGGVFYFDGIEGNIVDAEESDCIDTLGAGDNFAGAFLYAICANYSWQLAAKLANMCAAKIVSQSGPRLSISEVTLVKRCFEEYSKNVA